VIPEHPSGKTMTDNAMAKGKEKKGKEWSTKHYTEK
jgi:hypothetical protein